MLGGGAAARGNQFGRHHAPVSATWLRADNDGLEFLRATAWDPRSSDRQHYGVYPHARRVLRARRCLRLCGKRACFTFPWGCRPRGAHDALQPHSRHSGPGFDRAAEGTLRPRPRHTAFPRNRRPEPAAQAADGVHPCGRGSAKAPVQLAGRPEHQAAGDGPRAAAQRASDDVATGRATAEISTGTSGQRVVVGVQPEKGAGGPLNAAVPLQEAAL
mmetsp:Transcript_33842/g.93500  ORF Transcript_33842/g.93500 Transcript_33842/m.93500 type:complete len:216 (+) Transcript_33842:227-874(+)